TLLIGLASRRLLSARKHLSQSADRVLKLAHEIVREKGIDAAIGPASEDEFRQIGGALLQLRQTLDDTLRSRQRVAKLLDQIGTLRLVLDADNVISQCSQGLCRLLGAADAQAAADIVHGQIDFGISRQLIHRGLVKDLDWQLSDVQGRLCRIRISGVLLAGDNLLLIGDPLTGQAPATGQDVSRRDFEGLIVVRNDGVVEAANASAERLLGLTESSAPGQKFTHLCRRQRCSQVIATRNLPELANAGDTIECTFNPDGSQLTHHVQMSVYELVGAATAGAAYAITLHDITWIRSSEARAHRLAFYDRLTELPNRALLIEQLGRAVGAARRRGRQFAVLFLDLDRFKDINDSLGHHAGDLLLQEVGQRLQEQLRESDFAARLGGDEFCILTQELDSVEDAGQLATRILETLGQEYRLMHQTFTPHASIGIGIYPDNGTTPETLLQAADTAMYEAKRRGKQQFVFYSHEMTRRARQRMATDTELRDAVKSRQFVLFYQPQIDLRTGRMVAVEALIRWQHPRRGLVPPDQFLAAAERLNLMQALGLWVLQTACAQLTAWHETGLGALRMAVNISPAHFQHPRFAAEVAAVLRNTALEPNRLEIEITEEMARDPDAHVSACEALTRLGVRVAIDDFGVGYSSLSMLKRLHVHTLKIDQRFVRDVMQDHRKALMLGGIASMAKGLELETVIEGVETPEQLELVHGLGCPLAQGYYFARPLPASAIPALAKLDFRTRHRTLPDSAADYR
ncbi:MAG: EAL domain-containing protein, partial [Luteimonas sp.]|nr:EAL domain-containing protein [Luteimonas sp.]